MSYFFWAALPLKPATIAMKIGHLALQVDLIYQLAKQHDLRRVIVATHKDGSSCTKGHPFFVALSCRCTIFGNGSTIGPVAPLTSPTTTSCGTLHVDSTDRTKTCKTSKQQLAELPDFLEKFTTKSWLVGLRIYIISISLYIYTYIYNFIV